MNRKQTEQALYTMAKSIARTHDLTIVTVEDSTNGLWDDMKFTDLNNKTLGEYFAEKYGNRLIETHFTAVPMNRYNLRKDFMVTVGYEFSHPRIEVGTQWGDDGYVYVVFCGDEQENNYHMRSAQILKETGMKYFRQIMDDWHRLQMEEFGKSWLE